MSKMDFDSFIFFALFGPFGPQGVSETGWASYLEPGAPFFVTFGGLSVKNVKKTKGKRSQSFLWYFFGILVVLALQNVSGIIKNG